MECHKHKANEPLLAIHFLGPQSYQTCPVPATQFELYVLATLSQLSATHVFDFMKPAPADFDLTP